MFKVVNTALLTEYAKLLHRHGVGSVEAEAYKEIHKADALFQTRASKLDNLKRNFPSKPELRNREGKLKLSDNQPEQDCKGC